MHDAQFDSELIDDALVLIEIIDTEINSPFICGLSAALGAVLRIPSAYPWISPVPKGIFAFNENCRHQIGDRLNFVFQH